MMKVEAKVLMVAVGAAVAFLTDFHSFLKARQVDPTVKYDWLLSLGRSLAGALAGMSAGVIG